MGTYSVTINYSSEWISTDTALDFFSVECDYYEEARSKKKFMLDNLKLRSMKYRDYSNIKSPLHWQGWRSRR